VRVLSANKKDNLISQGGGEMNAKAKEIKQNHEKNFRKSFHVLKRKRRLK
jgi:hypothetical protein